MEPLVSVIVPIYNVEKYLCRCVDSIINQTYKNLEIILVDDGATDSCGRICDEYKKVDQRFKVIHKKNGGLSDARNAGFRESNGQYICFIDSDDYIDPTYVSTLLFIIRTYNCDIAVCSFKCFDELINKRDKVKEKVLVLNNVEMISRMYKSETFVETVVAWNKLYKRNIFDGIEYPVGRIHEDEAITCELLYKANRIGITNEQLYFYTLRENSITSSSVNRKKLDDKLWALEKRLCFLKKIGLKSFYSKDNLRYLKQILKNYYITLEKDKKYAEKMRRYYRNQYLLADCSEWNIKNKLLMRICYIFPILYGKLKENRRKI